MSTRTPITTDAAPAAIGPYSQAMVVGELAFLSGQIPLRSDGSLVTGDLKGEVNQILDNLDAVATAAGSSLQGAVKLTVYLADLDDFAAVNEIMAARIQEPWPARAALGVAALPKGARVEIEAIVSTTS